MALLKWCFLLSFLAVAISDDAVEIPNAQVKLIQDQILQYVQSREDLLGILKEYPHVDRKKQSAIVNEFADRLIYGLNEFLKKTGIEPVALPGFEKEFFVLLVRGKVGLTDGELHGISTLERRGDISVDYEFRKLNLRLVLGLKKLTFQYNYTAKLLGLGPSGRVEGKSDGSKFTIDLGIDLTNLRANVDVWKLDNIGKVKVKFTGSITGQIINILSTVIVPLLKPIIKAALDLVIGGGLGSAVRQYNQIICSILGDCPTMLY